jgi:hypothetical protein
MLRKRFMNIATPRSAPASLTVILTLARLLERLERSPVPIGADQYRAVVQHLSQAIVDTPPGAPLQAVLDACPAAATLYENLNYDHAGLCRAPLEASMASELQARDAIAAARRSGTAGLAA